MTVAADGMGNGAFTQDDVPHPFTAHKGAKEVKRKTIWIEKHFTEGNVVGYNEDFISTLMIK